MSNTRKSLVSPRKRAYEVQSGRCFYCRLPMWQQNPEEFAAQYSLSPKQVAQLKCTGEHLKAHSEGGKASNSNIVAACWYCNRHRHKHNPARALDPEDFREHVRKRMAKGRWHQVHKRMQERLRMNNWPNAEHRTERTGRR